MDQGWLPLSPLWFGEVVDDAVTVFRRGFWAYLLTAAITGVPVIVLGLISQAIAPGVVGNVSLGTSAYVAATMRSFVTGGPLSFLILVLDALQLGAVIALTAQVYP